MEENCDVVVLGCKSHYRLDEIGNDNACGRLTGR